ncbi:PCI domain-containing protein [Cryptosporidium andersoni]|uniref:PCI domain-containing protein n=1 Tax=Cryptosporidium andersoni TaxID=117008 RepID=A0A1J4MQA4_9CRYT|nr:PCI domain-containing protein [Cryptosporidium andersoni]
MADIYKHGYAENYDNINLISPYMDSKMLLYIVKWLKGRNIYDEKSVLSMEVQILKTTHLYDEMRRLESVDLAETLAKEIENTETMESLAQSLKAFITTLKRWKDIHDESSRSLKRKSLAELQQWYISSCGNENIEFEEVITSNSVGTSNISTNQSIFPPNPIQQLLRLSRLYYLSGRYKESQNILDILLKIIPECTNIEIPLTTRIECYFGSIANGIVSNLSLGEDIIQPSMYLNYFQLIDDTLSREFHKINPKQVYLYKSWLVHWALFPLFNQYVRESSFNTDKTLVTSNYTNNPHGIMGLGSANSNIDTNSNTNNPANNTWCPFLDWFASERNFQVVAIICPHLFRYLACFGILMRRHKDILDSIVNTLSFHRNSYRDSFTELLHKLLVDFDFDSSQEILVKCNSIMENDYFLFPLRNFIQGNARLLIFEIYCSIHKSIDLDTIAHELNMTNTETERWIVNLIRNLHLDGKLDYERNRVEMIDRTSNASQVISDKTRSVLFRSNMLAQNIGNNPLFNSSISNQQKGSKSNASWRANLNKQINRSEK